MKKGRSPFACVLLEHLLELDFEKYFSLLRGEVSQGRLEFLDALSRCFFFGEDAEDHKKEIAKYMRKATRGLPDREHVGGQHTRFVATKNKASPGLPTEPSNP
jgi:hypothetical protein